MKTPKRHHELTTMEHICTEKVWDFSQEHVNAQRWKRKNRVKQLKRTIAKYKNGEKIFHERSHLKSAYLNIQKLGELESTASLAECRGHLLLVECIIKKLRWEQEKALRYIEIQIDKTCPDFKETEQRKEQQ